MLKYLENKNNSWKGIAIDFPRNSLISLQKLIKQQSKLFEQINYKLHMEKTNHPQYGKCDSFVIQYYTEL